MDPMHSYSSVQRLSASSLQDAYGYDCLKIAHHILDQNREAEACVTLSIREAAETALPADANALRLCLLRRTRAVSIEHYRAQQGAKRDVSMFLVVLDRLSECVPVRADGLDDSLLWEEEATRAGEAINRFLGGLPQRFQPADGPCKMDAVLFEIDTATRRCISVQRVDIS
jgi:hypothetical protein